MTAASVYMLVRIIWALQPPLEIAILIFMVRRNLFRPYLSFALYLILDLIAFPIEFVLNSKSYLYYFWFHWPYHAALALVSLWVLGTLFMKAFEMLPGFQHLGKLVFHWGAVLSFALCLAFVLFFGGKQGTLLMKVLIGADELTCFMQVMLVVLLLGAVRYMGLSRQSFALGVAVGFGFKAAIILLPGYLWYENRSTNYFVWRSLFEMCTYAVACLIWLRYAMIPRVVKYKVAPVPVLLQGWDMALSQLLRVPGRP